MQKKKKKAEQIGPLPGVGKIIFYFLPRLAGNADD